MKLPSKKLLDSIFNWLFLGWFLYAIYEGFREWKRHPEISGWHFLTDTAKGFIPLIVFVSVVVGGVYVFFRNDQSTDRLWLRAFRVIGFITTVFATRFAFLYFKQ
jgi:hypothetical protein